MVRLICYNIEYCEGIEGKWYQYLELWKILHARKKLEENLIRELKKLKPDILALVEVDIGSFRTFGQDEAKFFSKKMKLKNFTEIIKYPFKSYLSLFHFIPILDKQGNAVISKYKFKKVKNHILNEGTKRVVIEAIVDYKKAFTILLAHLSLGKGTRKKQINELIKITRRIRHPVILMGDFNTFNGEKEIEKILQETQLDDKIKYDKKDLHFTEPSFKPCRRLDYILTSKGIIVKKYRILKYPFSDHLPVMIDFDVR